MRRILLTILTLVLGVGLSGCGNSEKQEALLQYINNDCVEMAEIENKLLASYESVTGNNYVSDDKTYTEFTTNTIELAKQLNNKAVEVAGNIKDEEVLELHRIYMNYSNKFLSSFNLMIAGRDRQDMSKISEANERLNEANNLALDYKKELYRLAEKYNVEIQD